MPFTTVPSGGSSSVLTTTGSPRTCDGSEWKSSVAELISTTSAGSSIGSKPLLPGPGV